MKREKLLNLGCGNVYNQKWTNVDLYKTGKNVVYADLRKKLPFKTKYFDAVYCSHILEHFESEDAIKFGKEVYRILKPGGVIRIVVPDLEKIASLYLSKMKKAMSGDERAGYDYDWILLELFDQTTRTKTGGKMFTYIIDPKCPNKSFVESRIGMETEHILETNKEKLVYRYLRVVKSRGVRWLIGYVYKIVLSGVLFLLGGKSSYQAYIDGVFRNSGEIHQQMYDEYSLKRFLKSIGFRRIKRMDADKSNIHNFNDYELDTYKGKVRKPDSIFMEAVK